MGLRRSPKRRVSPIFGFTSVTRRHRTYQTGGDEEGDVKDGGGEGE